MSCKACEAEMRWPLCKAFQAGTFKKDKCVECYHTAADHGAAPPAAAPEEKRRGPSAAEKAEKKEEEIVRRRTATKPEEQPRAAPKQSPRKKSPSPKKKHRSPSPKKKQRSPSPVRHAEAASAAEEVKDTMRCVVAKDGTLSVETRPTPKPGKEEVLVRVRAAGLNQADRLQAQGKYPPPAGASDVLGLEVAGTVAKVGFGMKDFWGVGDRVCGLVAGGGYAEYCVVHGDALIELPERMSYEEGAGVAEAFLTAYQALFFLADLKNRVKDRKQNILVWGASGGVGSAAVQLARHVSGENTRVLGVAGSSEKCSYVKSIGAHVAINRKEDDLERVVERECGGKGVDILVDLVGAANFGANLKVMATDGVMIMLGFLSGSQCSETELRDILSKRITIKGSTLRSRDDQYKGILTQSFIEDFGSQLDKGVLKVEVDRKFDLDACNDAHRYMGESTHKGKIILTIPRSWRQGQTPAAGARGSAAEEGTRAEERRRQRAEDDEREKREEAAKREREREEEDRARAERQAAEEKRQREREERQRREKDEQEKAKRDRERQQAEEKEKRQREREERQRREREEEEREKRERERRVKEREEKPSGSSALGASSGAIGAGGFKACKSDLVDDEKSPIGDKETELIFATVNSAIKGTKEFSRGLASIDAMVKAFHDGVLPCVHLSVLCPKDIDTRALNRVDDDRDREENFTLYLGAARGVGATFDRSVTRQSLVTASKDTVFACLWQNIKCGFNVAFQREASIRSALAAETGAKEADIRDEWPANKIMFAWVAMMVKQRGIRSFADLAEHLPALTQAVTKVTCGSLAEAVKAAAKLDIQTVPEALSVGQGRVTFAFVGALFRSSLKK